MRDFARSDSDAVQAQLDRLAALSLPQGRLGLEIVRELLARLGNPHLALPPVLHVAGTNGKGSTCAFLRAILEAAGKRVHVASSPHLVRYNERIRLAGSLISDEALASVLAEVLDKGEDLGPSFFEVTIAATFLAFSRIPADVCVIEVGLGGRFDATNIIPRPAACGIAALGIDHERFLLSPDDSAPSDPMERIAFEKAGILKARAPYSTLKHPDNIAQVITDYAARVGAGAAAQWHVETGEGGFHYRSSFTELNTLPLPALPGAHQIENAGLAISMLEQAGVLPEKAAIAAGLQEAKWPARLQRLMQGPLTGAREIWLDGGHNLSAGEALAKHFKGQKFHLIIGMIEGKDPKAIIGPLATNILSKTALPVPSHDYFPPEAFGDDARGAENIQEALALIPDDGAPILIAGSLYLAGEVLRLNAELPS